ncbi:MAG: thioredoxin family protein [Candidatus Dojkabacteria bacterium]
MAVVNSVLAKTGWIAEKFMLPGTDGSTYLLSDFKDKQGLLVIFTCNHCPYAKSHWPIYIELYHKYKDDINFVAINPNEDQNYPEDSFDEMKKRTEEWEIPFPYLRDESQEIATKYDARNTPDSFLFRLVDEQFKLYYRGKVIDNWENPEQAEEFFLEDAMKDLIAGKEPPKEQPLGVGCSIKWK